MTHDSASAGRLRPYLLRKIGASDAEAWRLFFRYHTPHLRGLLFWGVISGIQALLILPVLALIRLAFDSAIPAGDIVLLAMIGGGIIAIRAFGSGLSLLVRRTIVAIVKRVISVWREDLLMAIYARRREALGRADIDRLQTRIVQESERADNLSHLLFLTLLPAAISAIALLIALFATDWQLAAVSAILAPLIFFVASATAAGVKKHVTRFQDAFELYNKGVSFVLRQMDLTRTQGFEESELRRQVERIDHLRSSGETMSFSFAVHRQIQATLVGLAGVCILLFGGAKVAWGDLTIGGLITFYLAAVMLNGFASTLIGALPDIVAGDQSLTKLREISASGEPVDYHGRETIAFRGGIRAENLHFAYDAETVLRGASIAIAPSEHVAIVGPNGAGKSTLLNLLLGLSKPQQGGVFADERAYENLDLSHLRRQIGVVLQRAGFFRGTVLENIAYGSPQAGFEDVRAAARLAGADEFVMTLEQGYETILGEGGVSLSGGEAQRLAIARALLRRPSALILDEPTNHLDVESVDRILKNIAGLPHKPTIILVSHDPRIAGFAEKVYRLGEGRLTLVLGDSVDDLALRGRLRMGA